MRIEEIISAVHLSLGIMVDGRPGPERQGSHLNKTH